MAILSLIYSLQHRRSRCQLLAACLLESTTRELPAAAVCGNGGLAGRFVALLTAASEAVVIRCKNTPILNDVKELDTHSDAH